jgi:hypothetical protein
MTQGTGTWRCGACVDEGRWGVSHLIESAVTFGDARCLEKSATYSVLVRFHADGAPPEPRFLHGRAPPGCTHVSEIQDPALVSDLHSRQLLRAQFCFVLFCLSYNSRSCLSGRPLPLRDRSRCGG